MTVRGSPRFWCASLILFGLRRMPFGDVVSHALRVVADAIVTAIAELSVAAGGGGLLCTRPYISVLDVLLPGSSILE